MSSKINYSTTQLAVLVVLRVAIGWHFFYEGLVKLLSPSWTALPYLVDSQGPLKGFFESIAANPTALGITNFVNIWALLLAGFALISGLLTRTAALGAILLLAMYYLSHPALPLADYAAPSEGSYLYVNKTIIEMAALWVLYSFPTSHRIGLDRFINKLFCKN